MIVPMDDWLAEAGHDYEEAAAGRVVRGHALEEGAIAELVEILSGAAAPALVAGAGADDAETWAALVELSELLRCPVWQESFVVLANGGYAVMNRLVERQGGASPWPGFAIDIAGIARSFGCPAQRIDDHATLLRTLDGVLPELAKRGEPLLLEVVVEP